MSIIMFLGKDVNEYEEKAISIITKALENGKLLCEYKQTPLHMHMKYERYIKQGAETEEKLKITVSFVICNDCEKRHGHALLPDFTSPYKQYGAAEIEGVIIDSGTKPVKDIDTEASEPSVRRWIKQVSGRITGAVSRLKAIFMDMGRVVSEILLTPGHCYSELEQMLDMAPAALKYSGCLLGLANIWLGRQTRRMYI